MKLIIMAAGKSSRFGKPKIGETLKYNMDLFHDNFDSVNIFCSYDNLREIVEVTHPFRDRIELFAFKDLGMGSGADIIKAGFFGEDVIVAWSDAIFTHKHIQKILTCENSSMLIAKVKNAYVNMRLSFDKVIGYSKGGAGFQDCSIFRLNKDYFEEMERHYKNKEIPHEFMDLLSVIPLSFIKVKRLPLNFNTQEEFKVVKKKLKEKGILWGFKPQEKDW